MKTNRDSAVKYTARGSLFCVLLFAVLVIILHVLRPQMNPLYHTVSEYEIGPYGYIMTTAFVARGLGMALLVAALALDTVRGNRSWTGLVLLSISALCSLLVAIFPPDPHNMTSSVIHSVSAFVDWICLFIAALVWARRLRKDTRWRFSAVTSLVLGLLMLLSIIAVFATASGLAGLTERILEIIIILWLGFMAWRLSFFS